MASGWGFRRGVGREWAWLYDWQGEAPPFLVVGGNEMSFNGVGVAWAMWAWPDGWHACFGHGGGSASLLWCGRGLKGAWFCHPEHPAPQLRAKGVWPKRAWSGRGGATRAPPPTPKPPGMEGVASKKGCGLSGGVAKRAVRAQGSVQGLWAWPGRGRGVAQGVSRGCGRGQSMAEGVSRRCGRGLGVAAWHPGVVGVVRA